MSNFETFFSFSLVSTLAATSISAWFYYVPKVIARYRVVMESLEQKVVRSQESGVSTAPVRVADDFGHKPQY
jgi:hypothetical protein